MEILSEVFRIDILFIIIIITLYLVYYYSTKTFNYFEDRGIKYLKPIPFFGNAFDSVLNGVHFTLVHKKVYDSFKDERVVGYFSNRSPVFMLRSHEVIQQILIKDFNHFYDRSRSIDENLDPLRAYNLINLHGKKWKSLRQKLTPAFSSGKLKFMFQQFTECGDELLQYLDTIANHESIADILEVIGKFSTDVIGTCAFGLQFNSLKDPDSEFRRVGREILNVRIALKIRILLEVVHEKLPSLLKMRVFKKEYDDFFMNLTKNTIKYREDNKIERNDFMQILINLFKQEADKDNQHHTTLTEENNEDETDNIKFDDKVLAANTFVFFVAGFESTASTLSYCLFELSLCHNVDIQNRVRNEILSTIKKHNNQITDDTIKDMTYLDCVISETLRKYPVAGLLVRICTKPYNIPDTNISIKKGERVLIPVYAIHHDPEYYPQPDLFDPDRFSEENKNKRPNFTFMPFGAGPRACIGSRFARVEMKVALTKILSRYEVSLNDKTQLPLQWIPKKLLLYPTKRIWLNFKRLTVSSIDE